MIDERRFAGRQGRLLFAYLVLDHGRPVPRHELADVLWGEAPPPTWEKALRVLVSKLRALLTEHGIDGATALTGAFGCYRLELPDTIWVDVGAAIEAVQEAEGALAAREPARARAAASAAASVARQRFMPGEEGEWVDAKRAELADVHGRAVGALADACLGSGDTVEAVTWAEQAIALDPFRETGYRRLMEAHAAAGNRAEALRVYERCRRLLAEELGAYPSPETESVYRRLLEAPTVAAEAARSAAPSKRAHSPSRTRVGIATVIVVVAAATGAAFATRGGGSHTAVAANSVVALDPSGSIDSTVQVGARPVAIVPAAGSLWVANLDDQTVTRIDISSRHVLRTIPIGNAPTALASARRGVWVTDRAGNVTKIDSTYDRPTLSHRLAAAVSGMYGKYAPRPTLAAFRAVWIVDPDGYVSRVDPETGRREGSVDVGNDPSAIGAGAGSLWVTNSADGTVTRIDPATLLATSIPVGHGPAAVAVNEAGVWIALTGDNTLVRVDPDTNTVAGTARVGAAPAALLATRTALWVANAGEGTLMRVDPRTGTPNKTIHVGGTPNALAEAAGRIWVTVAPSPPPRPAAGGVARLTTDSDLAPLDPALDVFLPISYATCANLVTYPDKPAPAGSRIVPEVAEAVPSPTDGGRTYTFKIRPGFRFSPPSNEAVTAATFKETIERVTNPRLKARQLSFAFRDVVGYRAYVAGKADALSGVVARGDTLTIRLSRPNGGLLAGIATGSACAVPRGTPAAPGGIDVVPSAGPYYISSYTPRQQLVLRRNPNYHGDRPHRLDQIVFTFGVDRARALREVEVGRADYAFDGLPDQTAPMLEARYGPRSRAAKAGYQQFFISQAIAARWLHMNTSRPLFSSVRLRRAVNFAIDRPALVAAGRRFAGSGGPWYAGEATADYLPPPTDGAADFHLYPVNGPDLRRAKRIAGPVHATAVMYTPNTPPWVQEAQIIRSDLKPLGIDVHVHAFPGNEFFARIARRGEPFDLAVSGWLFGPDPDNVLNLFGGTVSASGVVDFSYLENRAFDRKLRAVERLSGTRRYRAYRRLALWLERTVAPAAAFATNASRDFFSRRMGCQVYQPFFGIDLGALCLRR